MTRAALMVMVLLLEVGAVDAGGNPCAASAPAPTGPHAVSSLHLDFVDDDRQDPFVEGEPRRYTVTFYYPSSSEASPAHYATGLEAKAVTSVWPIPPDFGEQFCLPFVPPGSVAADGEFPVILFSPGLSWTAVAYRSILLDLASHGYVVGAVSHPHATALTVFADGSTIDMGLWPEIQDEDEREQFLARHLSVWTGDLRHLGERLRGGSAVTGTPLEKHLDFSPGIGVMGHSYGGSAAAATLDGDTYTAAFVMEGQYRGAGPGPVRLPGVLMHLIGSYNRLELEGGQYAAGEKPVYQVIVNGAWHASFSDLVMIYSAWADEAWHDRHRNEMRPDRAIQIIRSYARAFFDGWLRGVDSPYLHPVSVAQRHDSPRAGGFPEVEMNIDVRPEVQR